MVNHWSCLMSVVLQFRKLKRHFEARIFSLPQVVFHCPVDKIYLRTYLRCAFYWHKFPRDQPQPGFFLEARERTLGTRLTFAEVCLSSQSVHLLKVCWVFVKRTYFKTLLKVYYRCVFSESKRSSFKSVLNLRKAYMFTEEFAEGLLSICV